MPDNKPQVPPAEPAVSTDEGALAAFDENLKQLWDWNFTNHAPSADAVRKMEGLRSTAKSMKDAIIAMAPHSRERSLALTSLEQTLFYAVAAIARQEPVQTDSSVDDTPAEDKALADSKSAEGEAKDGK